MLRSTLSGIWFTGLNFKTQQNLPSFVPIFVFMKKTQYKCSVSKMFNPFKRTSNQIQYMYFQKQKSLHYIFKRLAQSIYTKPNYYVVYTIKIILLHTSQSIFQNLQSLQSKEQVRWTPCLKDKSLYHHKFPWTHGKNWYSSIVSSIWYNPISQIIMHLSSQLYISINHH